MLYSTNLDGRGGSDLFCLHKGSRNYQIITSKQIQSGQFLSPILGNLGDFCENREDILLLSQDFNADGLSDLFCRHLNQGDNMASIKLG